MSEQEQHFVKLLLHSANVLLSIEPRQANLCLWAFRHDKV